MDVDALLVELVSIDSTNPKLDPSAPGEAAMGERLGELLVSLGFSVETHVVAPGRSNVVGVLPGDPSLPAVLLEAHLDTVPAPAGGIPVRRDGERLYGRGACDCKGALAAMLVAVERLAASATPRPTIVLAGVVDEETSMTGSAALARVAPARGRGRRGRTHRAGSDPRAPRRVARRARPRTVAPRTRRSRTSG